MTTYNFKDLTGMKFGKLTVTGLAYFRNHRSFWNCTCDCGKSIVVRGSSLSYGNTKSCGCLGKNFQRESLVGKTYNTKYPLINGVPASNTRIYSIWVKMKYRCNSSSDANYKRYGALGIKVCDKWLDFMNFYEWSIQNGYSEELTIDRINPQGNYEPSNCRWITPYEQSINRRDTVYIKINGKIYNIRELSLECDIPEYVIKNRYYAGWPAEYLTAPLHKYHAQKINKMDCHEKDYKDLRFKQRFSELQRN